MQALQWITPGSVDDNCVRVCMCVYVHVCVKVFTYVCVRGCWYHRGERPCVQQAHIIRFNHLKHLSKTILHINFNRRA